MAKLLRALRTRSFALLWSGQLVSLLGDRVFQVALAWWVLEETGSAVAMGTVFIVSIVPMLIFLLIGGVMVDRFPRVRLMLISDLVRGIVMTIMALLATSHQLVLWHVYLISLVSGFVEAFFMPAYRATVPEITPQEDLPSANSLTSLSGQMSGIVGPALGALFVAVGGTAAAFTVNSLSFFVAGACLLPILNRTVQTSKQDSVPESARVLADLRTGLRAVFGNPWLWITIGIAGISNIAYAGPMEVALPFLIERDRGGGVSDLGLFFSLSSVGAILGAVWLGRLDQIRHRGPVLYISWMIVGLMVALMGLPVPIVFLFVVAIVMGFCNTTLGLVWENTLQEFVPRHLLGRVASVDYLGSYLLLPVGYGVGGLGAEALGPSMLFILGGLLHASLIALGLLHPAIRNLD